MRTVSSEVSFVKVNQVLEKSFEEGKENVFLYHYFTRLIIEAKTTFLLSPTKESIEIILKKIKNIAKYINLRRNYRLVGIHEIRDFELLSLQEMLLQSVVYPQREAIDENAFWWSCVNWALFFSKFFTEISWGKIEVKIAMKPNSIHVFPVISLGDSIWFLDIFDHSIFREVNWTQEQLLQDHQIFLPEESEKFTAKPQIHLITFYKWKKLEMLMTTGEEYDRLIIKIVSWKQEWYSKKVFSRMMDTLDLDRYATSYELFKEILEKKDIPNEIQEAIKTFCHMVSLAELRNFLNTAG